MLSGETATWRSRQWIIWADLVLDVVHTLTVPYVHRRSVYTYWYIMLFFFFNVHNKTVAMYCRIFTRIELFWYRGYFIKYRRPCLKIGIPILGVRKYSLLQNAIHMFSWFLFIFGYFSWELLHSFTSLELQYSKENDTLVELVSAGRHINLASRDEGLLGDITSF